MQAQRFRRDLYYRLAALRIALPTLQERPQDVPVLLEHFFQQLGQRPSPLDAEAIERLCAYDWPGNVRELRNLVDRLRIHWPLQAGALGVAQLQSWLPELQQALPIAAGTASALPVIATRPSPAVLQQWLDDHQGNREQLATHLGVSRTTLWRWLRVTG